jgi:hypothetical protein
MVNLAPRHQGVSGEWAYSSTHCLTSTFDGGEWSTSRPGSFTPRERDPGTHWIGGCVGPRTGLDAVVKKKFPAPAETRTPDYPAQRYTTELSRLLQLQWPNDKLGNISRHCSVRLSFVRDQGREACHSPPPSAEVKNEWSHASTPQHACMAWCSVKAQGQLFIYLYPCPSNTLS